MYSFDTVRRGGGATWSMCDTDEMVQVTHEMSDDRKTKKKPKRHQNPLQQQCQHHPNIVPLPFLI